MPLFTYSGDDGRYYPELGLTCHDGQAVELDQAPTDGRFTAENGDVVVAVQPEPAPAPAPALDVTATGPADAGGIADPPGADAPVASPVPESE